MNGLSVAAEGHSLNGVVTKETGVIQFLGWSRERHWLMTVELPEVLEDFGSLRRSGNGLF